MNRFLGLLLVLVASLMYVAITILVIGSLFFIIFAYAIADTSPWEFPQSILNTGLSMMRS
jgi:hypothetical protein